MYKLILALKIVVGYFVASHLLSTFISLEVVITFYNFYGKNKTKSALRLLGILIISKFA